MNQISMLLFVVLIISCNSHSRSSGTIKIEGSNDSCYKLLDSVKRQIEIVENTLQDTLVLGFAVVPPKFIGNINYLAVDGRTDGVIYPETPEQLMPKTAVICVNLYHHRKVKGHLVLRLQH